MPKRLIITKVCFHIVAALLVIGAVVIVLVAAGPMRQILQAFTDMGRDLANAGPAAGDAEFGTIFSSMAGAAWAMMAVLSVILVGSAVGVELVIRGLGRLQYWAWIVGIVICGLLIVPVLHAHLISAALGGLGLWGLVDPESVRAFNPRDDTQTTTE